MTDIIFVAVLIAFFALAAVLVRACELIVGPDLDADSSADVARSDRAAA